MLRGIHSISNKPVFIYIMYVNIRFIAYIFVEIVSVQYGLKQELGGTGPYRYGIFLVIKYFTIALIN